MRIGPFELNCFVKSWSCIFVVYLGLFVCNIIFALTMACETYCRFVEQLVAKAQYTFITTKSVEKLASCFWPLMDISFKSQMKMEHRRKLFWFFALYLKRCVVSKNLVALHDMWQYLSPDAQQMWQSFPAKYLKYKVDQIL